MKTQLTSIAITVLLAVSNIFNSNSAEIYRAEQTNAAGQPTAITISHKQYGETLSPLKQYKFEYSADGSLQEKITYVWNDTNNTWEEISKYVYEYNDNNQLVSLAYAEWNKASQSWSDSPQYMVYIYGSAGELLAANSIK